MPNNSDVLQKLLLDELQDLYDAEKQLVKALPKVVKATANQELGDAIREHLEVTKGQVQRLEQAFAMLESRPKSRPCAGMRGLLEEGQHIMQEDMEAAAMDLALAGAARKVEHYEMVGYESVISLARQLGRKDAAQLLQETMSEEQQADRQLATISKSLVQEASRMQDNEGVASQSQSRKSSAGRSRSGKKSGSSGRGARKGSTQAARG